MRFKIVGANSETGDDVDVVLEAPSQSDVEKIAHEKGILVSSIASVAVAPPPMPAAHAPAPAAHANHAPVHAPANAHAPAHAPAHGTAAPHAPAAPAPAAHPHGRNEDLSAISLVDDDPPANGDPSAPHKEHAHGLITVSANSPSETAHTGSGSIEQNKHADAAMEYHIILNQSLFLLESAVNKHILQGWEPMGGLSVGMSNNALQFFQSMIRRKKPAP